MKDTGSGGKSASVFVVSNVLSPAVHFLINRSPFLALSATNLSDRRVDSAGREREWDWGFESQVGRAEPFGREALPGDVPRRGRHCVGMFSNTSARMARRAHFDDQFSLI